ncbi:hypothetical protein [Pseudomonas putida]|uniref:hypothetical protein n=1 Tax=Pseudomonas putida TaxID=303 RepID=UPI002746D445|nr:hypothetical protein [Pseudomonas putida]MDP9523400.1 hypothetical protein [Pseudomonas putida]
MSIETAALLLDYTKAAFEYPHTAKSSDQNPSFTVRVQLTDANLYDDLHDVMERHGFVRTIVDCNGILKGLPTGTYSYVAQTEYLSCQTVADYASDAVNEHLAQTNQETVGVELLVSPLTGAWFVLNEAKQPEPD